MSRLIDYLPILTAGGQARSGARNVARGCGRPNAVDADVVALDHARGGLAVDHERGGGHAELGEAPDNPKINSNGAQTDFLGCVSA